MFLCARYRILSKVSANSYYITKQPLQIISLGDGSHSCPKTNKESDIIMQHLLCPRHFVIEIFFNLQTYIFFRNGVCYIPAD